jgi:hypothetical protein
MHYWFSKPVLGVVETKKKSTKNAQHMNVLQYYEATYPELPESFPRIPTIFIVNGSQYPLGGSPKTNQNFTRSPVPTFWTTTTPTLKPTFHLIIRKMSSYSFCMRDLNCCIMQIFDINLC